MDFTHSPRTREYLARVGAFLRDEVEPVEAGYVAELHARADPRVVLPPAGLSNDVPLAAAWTVARALRLADGPDEVHRGVVARIELAPYVASTAE